MQKRRSFLADVDPRTINFQSVKKKLESKINEINSYRGSNYVKNRDGILDDLLSNEEEVEEKVEPVQQEPKVEPKVEEPKP